MLRCSACAGRGQCIRARCQFPEYEVVGLRFVRKQIYMRARSGGGHCLVRPFVVLLGRLTSRCNPRYSHAQVRSPPYTVLHPCIARVHSPRSPMQEQELDLDHIQWSSPEWIFVRFEWLPTISNNRHCPLERSRTLMKREYCTPFVTAPERPDLTIGTRLTSSRELH